MGYLETPQDIHSTSEIPVREVKESLLGRKHTVVVARLLAGVHSADMAKTADSLRTDRNSHIEALKQVTLENFDHSHIVEASTRERLVGNPIQDISPEGVRAANAAWGEAVADWLCAAPDVVAEGVARVYGVDRSETREQMLKRIEALRHQVFDGANSEHPAGEFDVRSLVTSFTRQGIDGEVTQAIPYEEVLQDLTDIEPFHYIFGGKETVGQLKHQILAVSVLENNAGEVGSAGREAFVKDAVKLLDEDVPEEDARYYPSSILQDEAIRTSRRPVAVKVSNEELVAPAPIAPIDGENVDIQETARQSTQTVSSEQDGQEEKHSETENKTYAEALSLNIERVMNAAGNEALKAAYESMLDTLGNPTITQTPLVDGVAIRVDMVKDPTDESEVIERVGNDFAWYEGRTVDLGIPDRKPWQQGMLANQTRTFNLDLFGMEGPKNYELAGLIGVVRGPDGNMLINLTQEPAATYLPKNALFRTPLQTSATKIDAVLDGQTVLDPTIAHIMEQLFPGKTIRDLLASGDIYHFFPPDADGNRLISDNLGFELVISDPEKWTELLASGRYYAASDREIDMLSSIKLVNGITSSSNSAARGARILRELQAIS